MQLAKLHIRVKSILCPHAFIAVDVTPFQLFFCNMLDGLPLTQPDTKDDSVYLKAAKCL